MNFIEITGGTKKQRELIENSVITLCNRYLKRFKLDLEIELVGNIEEHGFCIWSETNIRPRAFTITLNKKLNKEELLLVLAHEMVHVKQWVRGELKDTNCGKQLWKNKDYTNTNYDNQPWEIEAHELEYEWVNVINN